MTSCFVAGLKDDVRLGVPMFRPTSLSAATNLARLQEEKNQVTRRISRPENSHRFENTQSRKLGSNGSSWNSVPPIKKLSSSEMKERRDKGLCYNCDDKYSPGHRCKTQRLYLLDGAPVENDETEEETGDSQLVRTEDFPEISLHAISGTLNPQTMRLKGTIGKHSVVVLVDSGSAHNFIDLMTARKTGVNIRREGTMEVMVANGDKLHSSGCCKIGKFFCPRHLYFHWFLPLKLRRLWNCSWSSLVENSGTISFGFFQFKDEVYFEWEEISA